MPSYQFHLQCELWLCFVLFFLLLMVFHAAGALIKAGKFISLFRRQWSMERTVGVQLNCVKLDVLQRYTQCDVQNEQVYKGEKEREKQVEAVKDRVRK